MHIKYLLLLLCAFGAQDLFAQELFVYSEPASNMPAKSIGLRVANNFANRNHRSKYDYQLTPELMLGVSKKLMVHAEGFAGSFDNGFRLYGGALYVKYRLYSQDEVHSHFRVAAYAKAAAGKALPPQTAIDLNGRNSGYEAGVVATKLINKFALSAGSSIVHATGNIITGEEQNSRNALSYNLSFGKLLLPKEYGNYNQTNLNLMLEILGQSNAGSGDSFIDIAPSLQLIILSRMRVEFGYRFAAIKRLSRDGDNSYLVRAEYNIFNAFK